MTWASDARGSDSASDSIATSGEHAANRSNSQAERIRHLLHRNEHRPIAKPSRSCDGIVSGSGIQTRMKPDIRAKYTQSTRDEVARRVGVAPDAMKDVGGFESFVHEAELDGRPVIVKATWSGRRTPGEMTAEQHFVGYLADHDAPVCRFVPLVNGELLDSVDAEDCAFHVTAQVKAPGVWLERGKWTDETFRAWGRAVGTLHRLAADYPGPPPGASRPTWEEEHEMFASLLAHEPPIHAAMNRLLAEIAEVPRDRTCFGAMHTDLHHGNLHWVGDSPTIFDFEDMLDFWFVSDLAIVLYYGALSPPWTDDLQADYDRMKGCLLEGYAEQHSLPQSSWDALPLFLRLREHVLRAVVIRSLSGDLSEFQKRFLEETAVRIVDGSPALGLRP